MTDSVFKLNDVHQLVEHLSSLLQKAIILENRDFELIAYSAPSEYSFDSIQQKTILTKRCPLFVIEHLKKEGVVTKLKEADKPIRVHLLEDTNFYQRIAMSVKHRNQFFGYLWIYEAEESYTKEQLGLITQTVKRIGEILYNSQLAEKTDVHSLLWKLVNGEFTTEMEIFRAAKQANYTLPTQFSVVILSVRNAKYLYVLDKVKEMFASMNIVYYLGKGTEIIGVFHGDDTKESNEKDIVQTFLEQIEEQYSAEVRKSLFIGVGNRYNSILKFRKSYLEALEVIETKSFLSVTKQRTFFYNELGLLRHLKMMYKKNVTDQYRNVHIVTLMDKDVKTNSELVKTVWYYLKNDCKIGQTANELFIHHNTLHYRLKQVDELTSINFNDVVEKVELFLELYLIHFVDDYYEHYRKVL